MSAPNPVQRRAGQYPPKRNPRQIAADDLIAPCANEGGTFRDPSTRAPAPQRPDYVEIALKWAQRALLTLCAAILVGVILFAHTPGIAT